LSPHQAEVFAAERLRAHVVRESEEASVDGHLGGMGPQRVEFAVQVLRSMHSGRHEVVVDDEGKLVGIHLGETGGLTRRTQFLDPLAHDAARERCPVDLGDIPWRSEIGAERRRGGESDGVHRDSVRLNVIGMTVSTEVVVGDEHLRAHLADDPHKLARCLEQVGAPECTLAIIGGGARHARIPIPAGTTEQAPVGHAQDAHCLRELTLAVLAEPVLLIRGQVLQAGHQHLALFAEGARHEGHPHPGIDVAGHDRSRADRLVVGVGVDEQDPAVGHALRVVPGSEGTRRAARAASVEPLRQDVRVTQTASDESYPRQRARTRGFRLGAPRSFVIDPDREQILFLRSGGGSDPVTRLWSLDLSTDSETCVADPGELLDDAESLPAEERARRERLREVSAGITDFATDRAASIAVFALSGTPYAVRVHAGEAPSVVEAPGPVIDPRPDPTGTWAAYVSGGALYVAPLDGGPARALCTPEAGNDDVTWGLADFIAAEEFDRVRGYWWLADGSGLLVERVDATPVEQWWIADPAHPDQPARPHRYPAAGRDNAAVSLWLVLVDDGPMVEVEWDHADLPYLARVAVPEVGWPIVTLLSRDQRRQVIVEVDPTSGQTHTLRERTDPEWVELMPGVPTRTAGGQLVEIVADREVDAYRLVVDGVAMTPPTLQVESVVDAGPEDVLIVAGSDPTRPGLHGVSSDGAVTALFDDPSAMIHGRRSGDLVLTSTTRMDSTATDIAVWKGANRIASITSYAEIPVIEPRVHVLQTGEPRLDIAVLFPSGHTPGSKRLPVIMSPYGGPHARRVVAAGLAYGTDQWLADQGYCVVVADGRGTPGRGPAWDRAVRGDLASPALEDQVTALQAVAAAYPDDVDPGRVGIRGWSFGGYLAALAVLRRPDVFHAAVAGAPVTEWRLYDTGYTERYLGLPQDDPQAYDRSSLLPLAANLTRPLLIIHGLADDNVVVAHTLQLSSALLAAGKPHSVLPLTGVTHMTPQEVVAENLLRAEVDFFGQALR
jgi:dipeptidyl-peptidase-4